MAINRKPESMRRESHGSKRHCARVVIECKNVLKAGKLAEHTTAIFEVVKMKSLVTQRTDFVFQQDVDEDIVGRRVTGAPIESLENVELHVLELAARVLITAQVLEGA